MTFDEMLSFTVDGGKATCELLPTAYVDYPFNGWRVNFSKASSGLDFTDDLKAAEWHEWQEPVKQGWSVEFDLPVRPKREPFKIEPGQGRRGRKPKFVPTEINDIDDAKPEPVNPWAAIKKQGWNNYG